MNQLPQDNHDSRPLSSEGILRQRQTELSEELSSCLASLLNQNQSNISRNRVTNLIESIRQIDEQINIQNAVHNFTSEPRHPSEHSYQQRYNSMGMSDDQNYTINPNPRPDQRYYNPEYYPSHRMTDSGMTNIGANNRQSHEQWLNTYRNMTDYGHRQAEEQFNNLPYYRRNNPGYGRLRISSDLSSSINANNLGSRQNNGMDNIDHISYNRPRRHRRIHGRSNHYNNFTDDGIDGRVLGIPPPPGRDEEIVVVELSRRNNSGVHFNPVPFNPVHFNPVPFIQLMAMASGSGMAIRQETPPDWFTILPQSFGNTLSQVIDRTLREYQPQGVPLARELVNQLPIEKYNSHNDAHTEPMCTIYQTDFSEGDDIKVLPCGHYFTPNGIDRWFQTNNTCPMCRANITDLIQIAINGYDIASEHSQQG